ncbi:MAG TPA: hydroxymethylbilane synthase [Microthrixaceae bacterium]|nr:hydroxymethylbilane synthase [Microthrixaceae bacterium]
MTSTETPIRIATRGSALALWQAHHVADLICAADAECRVEIVEISTEGDRLTDVPLAVIGGKGVFVKEVQSAVLDGRADVAVHSAKDLPAVTPAGLVIAAVPERADARDVLVGCRLADLRPGAVVATGSPRRRSQLAGLRPDLRFEELRGNIDTRLTKASQFDAIVMAAAALDRLGRRPAVVDHLPVEVMVPQVGQGALAVECRQDDRRLVALLSGLDHPRTRLTLEAERSFLTALGGDCDLPAGAHAVLVGPGPELPEIELPEVELTGVLAASRDGAMSRVVERGADAESLGATVAERLLGAVGGSAR